MKYEKIEVKSEVKSRSQGKIGVKWSQEVKWRSQGKSGVKSRSGGKARMKSSQEWSQEVKMNRRNEEAKNEELKKPRIEE